MTNDRGTSVIGQVTPHKQTLAAVTASSDILGPFGKFILRLRDAL